MPRREAAAKHSFHELCHGWWHTPAAVFSRDHAQHRARNTEKLRVGDVLRQHAGNIQPNHREQPVESVGAHGHRAWFPQRAARTRARCIKQSQSSPAW